MNIQRSFLGLCLIITLALLSAPHSILAQNGDDNFGVGLMIGEPTGISFKYWSSQKHALAGGAAWSLGQYEAVHLHGDYLWHTYSLFDDIEKGQLPFYYGIGGRVVLVTNDAILGVRVPVGLNYRFENSPLDLFLEVAPTMNLVPDTDFDINGALGMRIYF